MKRRRTLIISLLLVAAMALGIGYAGFTSELLISGDAVISGTELSEVVISNVTLTDSSSNVELKNLTGLDTKTVNADLTGFNSIQDYALLTVEVENPHEFDVAFSKPAIVLTNNDVTPGNADSAKYFKFELVNENTIPTTIGKATFNTQGEKVPTTITFQVKVTPLTIVSNAHTASYTITASASTR